jgi:CBS domain-containing protein
MKISETMTRDVQLAAPTQTIMEAAQMMADLDVGALPVAEDDRLVGMVTDRDIVLRALARGRGPETPIREVMSAEILYCFDDEAIEDVALNMGDIQVRRLPVLNRDKRLVGIVSIADIACDGESRMHSGQALEAISRPGGQHSQSNSRSS